MFIIVKLKNSDRKLLTKSEVKACFLLMIRKMAFKLESSRDRPRPKNLKNHVNSIKSH